MQFTRKWLPGCRAIVEYRGLREAVFVDGSEIIFWVVAAAVGIVGEVFTAPFFLVFFAFGALVALVLTALGLGLPLQIVGFVAASVVSMLVLRPTVLHRLASGSSEQYESRGSIVGRNATVTITIEPDGSGTIRVGSGEFWTARALYPGKRIDAGVRVRVLDTDGLTALVEAVEIEGGETL
jgi:membrane protein implicated in regulation of membrane protease activity